MNSETIGNIVAFFIVGTMIFSLFLHKHIRLKRIKSGMDNKERFFSDVIEKRYGFTYKQKGIFMYPALKEAGIYYNPLAEHAGRIPFHSSYDYISGNYKGIYILGSSIRLYDYYDCDGILPGYCPSRGGKNKQLNEFDAIFYFCGYMVKYRMNEKYCGNLTMYRKNMKYQENKDRVYTGKTVIDDVFETYTDKTEMLNRLPYAMLIFLCDNDDIRAISFKDNHITILINSMKTKYPIAKNNKINIDYFPKNIKNDDKEGEMFILQRFEYLLRIADFLITT